MAKRKYQLIGSLIQVSHIEKKIWQLFGMSEQFISLDAYLITLKPRWNEIVSMKIDIITSNPLAVTHYLG